MTEYEILTTEAGVLDRSEDGKLALTGPDAKAFLHGQVTNDIEGLAPGRGCYAAWLDHKGKMQGDLRVLDLGGELLLLTERASLQELFNMIRRYRIGRDVELHKRTLERGLLSVIGPAARALTGAGDLGFDEHDNAAGSLGGRPVTLVATDAGVDVVCDSADTDAVRAAIEAPDVSAATVEILRVEAGRPRWGRELDTSVIPQEAGLNDRAVSFTKGCYVGQETVARLFYKGKPNRHLRRLRLDAPGAQAGDELRLGEKVVGRIGTAVESPQLGPVALALVRREAPPGESVEVADRGISAMVEDLTPLKQPG